MYRMVAVTSHREMEKWIGEKENFADSPKLQQLYLKQIERIAASDVRAVILREKDLPENVYETLARRVVSICETHKKECILHTYINVALRMEIYRIHLPLALLEKTAADSPEILKKFHVIGSSVHSIDEAERAYRMGATYITAGHVYVTDCKRGLAPRGVSFLKSVCEAVPIPVYGIGGINKNNIQEVLDAGAAAGCIMSGAMKL